MASAGFTGDNCKCGLPSALRVCGKQTSPNYGREFYTCPKTMEDNTRCNFYRWKDGRGNLIGNSTGYQPPQQNVAPPNPAMKTPTTFADYVAPPEKKRRMPSPTTSPSTSDIAVMKLTQQQMMLKAYEQNTLEMEKLGKICDGILLVLQKLVELQTKQENKP